MVTERERVLPGTVPRIAPSGLQLTRSGRVRLQLRGSECGELCDPYLAPEFRPGGQVACDASLEKMLIYSLGRTLQTTLGGARSDRGHLEAVLQSMVRPDPASRASLMDLLDVISEHCKTRGETKPISHFVMDLYREVLGTFPQCLPWKKDVIQPTTVMDSAQRRANSFPNEYKKLSTKDTNTKTNKSSSLTSETERHVSRRAVQRAPSRLYRAAAASSREIDPHAKYCCPNTCIGPEFIVRASKPSKVIHIEGVKAACRKKVVVMLLNGQKIDVTCDQNTTTAGQIFEVVVSSEGLEDNFTLGLAALLGGDFAFLPHKTKLRKVAPVDWCGDSKKNAIPNCTFTLYLRVKFFMPSLRGVRNWNMKHLLYLQLRRSLLEQQIQCDIDQHVALGGLALQSEFGDYSAQEHGHGSYFLLDHYIPEKLLIQHKDEQGLRTQMQLMHKERQGLDPGRAEERYITLVQMLNGYGSHFYNAVWEMKDGNKHEMLLAIDSQGLTLYKNHRNERQLHEFLIWKRVQLLSYSKQYLFITPQCDNKGSLKPTKYKLQMDQKKSFFVFHLASFHHQIYLKLRYDVSSLQSLTAEFGVSIKNHPGRKSALYQTENSEASESHRQRHVFISPAVTLCNNTKHVQESIVQKAVTVSQTRKEADIANRAPFCECAEFAQYVKQINIEEDQNKENENPKAQDVNCSNCCTLAIRNEQTKAANFGSRTEVPARVCSTLLSNTVNDVKGASFPQRIRVQMGTKAFSDVHNKDSSSYQKLCDAASTVLSDTCKCSSLHDAYVLNSSIKSAEEKFEVDFQETLSKSLLEKFDTLSCKEERILRIVKVRRDECGNLGLRIKAGLDGGLYVQSVEPGGPAAAVDSIHRGDQLIAMDGHNLLNLKYEQAMDLLRSSGAEVEILLSQASTDIGIFMSEKEVCDTETGRHIKHSDQQDSHESHTGETSCGALNVVPAVHPEPSSATSVEDSYLNNIQYQTAVEVVSGGEEFKTLSAPTAKQQLHAEKHLSCGRSRGSIRAVCCMLHTKDS